MTECWPASASDSCPGYREPRTRQRRRSAAAAAAAAAAGAPAGARSQAQARGVRGGGAGPVGAGGGARRVRRVQPSGWDFFAARQSIQTGGARPPMAVGQRKGRARSGPGHAARRPPPAARRLPVRPGPATHHHGASARTETLPSIGPAGGLAPFAERPCAAVRPWPQHGHRCRCFESALDAGSIGPIPVMRPAGAVGSA
jgi:hypothetical protein